MDGFVEKGNIIGNDLGSLVKTFRPYTRSIWMLPLLAIGPILMLLLAIVLTVSELTYGPDKSFSDVSNYLLCIGPLGLLIAVLAAVWTSDFRAWRATRTVEMKIFEHGFVWMDNGVIDTCRWEEIEKLRYRDIYVSSKAFKRMVKVIKSIHTTSGKTIKLPETLALEQITELITDARKRS